uniref:Laccase n=1 Tax=Davidia involucrata TaxID=16924 RepID=A0A5B7AGX6_DAVIN
MGSFSAQFLIFVILNGILLCMVQAKVHYYDFVIKETNFTRLCHTKSVLVVNDSLPGPVIRVKKGDTVFVNVHNQGDYGFTLHWHGVKQPRNPWSDGPDYITQCKIQTKTNFTYEVTFSTEEGTLWWHAHSDWTRATVHGAIVIEPADGTTYPFPKPDAEEIIVVGSWYTYDLKKLVEEAIKTGSDMPRTQAYTINGEPGDLCPCSRQSTHNVVVDYGKTYHFRIVNANTNAEFFLAIAEHNVTVVGMDGAYVKPITTDYIMISPGQTIDFLVTANKTLGHYYIAGRQFSSADAIIDEFDHTNVTAIFKYSGNYSAPLSPYFPFNLPLYNDVPASSNFTHRLRSLANKDYPANVPLNISTRMFVVASMGQVLCPNASCSGPGGNRLASSLNNISWVNPYSDILRAYYGNITGIYTPDFPDLPPKFYDFTGEDYTFNNSQPSQGTRVKVVNFNETVEIIFQGTSVLRGTESHPMHLHGHNFYVVGSGWGNFNNNSDPELFNLVDPPLLNTFGVPKYGWTVIRFWANNPGVWYLHCHMDRHMSWGMDSVLIVKNGGTVESTMRGPPASMPSCRNSDGKVEQKSGLLQKPNVSDGKVDEIE